MFLAFRQRMRDREEGFTLIELLVVVIIIGILAAIAIPTFLNQRQRGWEADAQSNVRNAAIAQQSHFTQVSTSYANSVAELEAQGFVRSANVTVSTTGTANAYCIAAFHTSGGDGFRLESDSGVIERVTPGTDATCT